MPGIGLGLWIGRRRQTYWTQLRIATTFLFDAFTKDIAGGKLYNTVKGREAEYLTVTGSAGSYHYVCPNNATYIAADTDYAWFKTDGSVSDMTDSRLNSYDLQRTPVQFDDLTPNTNRRISILLSTVTLLGTLRDNVFKTWHLSFLWDNNNNQNGYHKDNRVAQNLWVPESIVDPAIAIINDGNTIGWFDSSDANTITKDGSDYVSIWWDKIYGQGTLGPELNSGGTIQYGVYQITACTANSFYTGCQVGDIFFEFSTTHSLTAINKVKRYSGNHLVQGSATKYPIWSSSGITFDGSNDYMRMAALASLIQPIFIYIVFKQITWGNTNRIFDGQTGSKGELVQNTSTPNITALAETALANQSLTIGSFGIVRVFFNGASSKFTVNGNAPSTGNAGASNMQGFTLGSYGNGVALWSNIQVKEVIVRMVNEAAGNEATIYTYLKNKYSL
jgi:hypothetical protein